MSHVPGSDEVFIKRLISKKKKKKKKKKKRKEKKKKKKKKKTSEILEIYVLWSNKKLPKVINLYIPPFFITF